MLVIADKEQTIKLISRKQKYNYKKNRKVYIQRKRIGTLKWINQGSKKKKGRTFV